MFENQKEDKIIINANIITMDPCLPQAESMAIKGNKIVAIGSIGEVQTKTPGAEIWDAKGMTILPGFIDNHVHFLQTGYSLNSLKLVDLTSWNNILEEIVERTKEQPPGTMIMGYGYDDHRFNSHQLINRWDLDRVAPEHLVWLNRVDFHSSIVNSNTLKELNLPANLLGIELDEQGVPTGVLRAEADVLARKLSSSFISEEDKHSALKKASQLALESGITTVTAMEGDVTYGREDIEFLLKNRDKSKLRLEIFYQTFNVEQVVKMGLSRIGGCLLLDGSLGSWTAAISEAYCDSSDSNWLGNLYLEQEFVNDFILKAHQAGLQITMHAIGDRAIEQILQAYQNALSKYPLINHRHRIEHFELPTKKHILKAKELGIFLSVQPSFEYYWGGVNNMYGMRLGPTRVRRTNPLREMLDTGVVLAGGSDASVTPLDPFYGIHAALNHPTPEQRVTTYEAFKMFTINGAIALGIEKECGSIEVGKLADLIFLKENPFEVSWERLKDIEVMMTMVGGEIVFTNKTEQVKLIIA